MGDANIIIPGFRAAAVAAGIRKTGRLDLGLIAADRPCAAAGLFTRNRVKAPSVEISAARLRSGKAQANTCVPDGRRDAEAATAAAAAALGLRPALVLMNSTGVIGEPIAINRLTAAVPALAAALRSDGLADFARAIMTTDTKMKLFTRSAGRGRNAFRLAAAAKGAGMIMPDMATMLCYVLTDAGLGSAALKKSLAAAAYGSLNALTIDGDTSTSDSLILMASGASAARPEESVRGMKLFSAALDDLLAETAEAIAADGEGATRWFRVTVAGAKSAAEADRVARRIANSPLVKTAFHAADPNWGRVMAAAGSAGVAIDPLRVSVRFEGGKKTVRVVDRGLRSSAYREADARAVIRGTGFTVRVDLGRGGASRSILTCDFSADYVRINADYRT